MALGRFGGFILGVGRTVAVGVDVRGEKGVQPVVRETSAHRLEAGLRHEGVSLRTHGREAESPIEIRPTVLFSSERWAACHPGEARGKACEPQPRPMNGILVAMIVMNCTLASSGRLAIWTTALATWATSISGSTAMEPFACGTRGSLVG